MPTRCPPVFFAASVAACLSFVTGCMPEAGPPVANGPIDTNVAAQLQARTRSSNGDKYSVTHEYKDQEFTANWELSNALKKSAQLQIKPPADWEPSDLYQALEIVLNGHSTNPWYPAIDDTVLKLMREALKADQNRATDLAPETPYYVAVKVKQHTNEWFLEVKVQILDEDGTAIGF
jgi:hypothetical protein